MARNIATFSRPADATAYASGDIIANSTTAASVVPMEFPLYLEKGLIVSTTCIVTPASGSLVIENLNFDLLLFAPRANIPFAAAGYPADNAAMNITAAAFRDLIAVFNFTPINWRNPAGTLTAGITGWQVSVPATRAMIEYDTLAEKKLIGVVQAKAAWNPGAVINRFDFIVETSYE